MTKETYSVSVNCANCGFSGVRAIQKGNYISDAHCPNCDCKRLELGTKSTWKTTTETKTFGIDSIVDWDAFDKMMDNFGKLFKK